MALPDNFSPAEHLQDTILKVQNKIVRAEFSDVGDDSWEPSISTSRASLRIACTHQESDSLLMTFLRNQLFFEVLRKCVDFHPSIYGIPSRDFQEVMRFFPQVQLYFEERYRDTEKGFEQLRSQVSFRLVNETTETFTKAEATTIANKIKALFDPGGVPFSWKRGKELASYIDQKKGYYFQLYVFDKTNAKKVIEQVLDINGHTPDWKLLNFNSNEEPTAAYPILPPTKTVLGKQTRQPRKRPVGSVRFVSAILHLYGKPEPLVLYDPNRRYAEALVR
jgi:hypothetical protein